MSQPFERQTPDVIGPGQKLRMLRDQILLEPLDWQPSHVIDLVRYGRPLRGIVRAIGPGCYQKRWHYTVTKDGNRQRSGYEDTHTLLPTEVKPGDIVELGGLNAFDGQGYQFQDVMIEGKTHLICREADVCGVAELPQEQANAHATAA